MYDIEFALPIVGNGPYLRRFLDFKQYGLLNIGSNKVMVKLLTDGTAPAEDIILRGWPTNVDAAIFSTTYPTPAPKIYSYYASIRELSARWFAKVDDDSCTDVDGLVKSLDRDFDHDRDYYIVTDLRKEHVEIDRRILPDRQHWFNPHGKSPTHEWEASVISQSAIRMLVANPEVIAYLQRRITIPDGYGDISLALAARMCKIYPVEATFMSQYAYLPFFSICGGWLNHIHYISHDRNGGIFERLKAASNIVPDNPLYGKIVGKRYRAGDRVVTLDKHGIIAPVDRVSRPARPLHLTLAGVGLSPGVYWDINNGTIAIYDARGNITTEMQFQELQAREMP